MSSIFAGLAQIQTPNSATMQAQANAALRMVAEFEIVDQTTYELAGEELRSAKAQLKAIEQKQADILDPLKKVDREVRSLFKPAISTLEQVEAAWKKKIITFVEAVEAEKAAARQEMERATAAAAEKRGEPEDDIAMMSAVAVAAPETPKAAGISKVRTIVKARVVDKAAFLQGALDNKVLLPLVNVDESKLSMLVRSMGMCFAGVEVYEEKSISARIN